MESTKLMKINSHFLQESSLNIAQQHADPKSHRQSTPDVRLLETDSRRASAGDESSAAALVRHVSISRSGRYKSKMKQRASLLANGTVDFSNTAVVFFADDILTSPDTVDPPNPTASERGQQELSSSSQTNTVETSSRAAADVVTVADNAAIIAVVRSSAELMDSEQSRQPVDKSCVTLAPADVCMEPSIAEIDESTDL